MLSQYLNGYCASFMRLFATDSSGVSDPNLESSQKFSTDASTSARLRGIISAS